MLYNDQTAIVVVDVQNDFADPDGSLFVTGAEDAMERINAEIARATQAGSFVVYTQDWHPRETPHFAEFGGVWPVHCVMDTWGAEFHPALDVVVDAPVVRKGSNGEDGYSGFTMRDPESGETIPTELAGMLWDRGIDDVVVVGLALDYCVRDTAIDGAGHGFATKVIEDATRAVNLEEGDDTRAMEAIEEAGAEMV
jgi:nicotinamidase/pyrazinamidase